MLPAQSNILSPGNALGRRHPADGLPPKGGRESEETPFAAALLAPGATPPPPRQALIGRIRGEIANGTYETQARIEALLPRLAKDLGLAAGPAMVGEERSQRENDQAHRRNAVG
jgi:hypothetical protein